MRYDSAMFRKLIKQEKLHGAIKWLLIIVIVVPMIFFGAMWVGGSWHVGPGGKAGELFGHAVPWEEFEQEYRLSSRSLQAQMGTIPEAFEPFLRQQTWDRLILKAEAKRTIRISDEQVARSIQTQPTFQLNGAFSPELYYQFLRSLGTSPNAFEERVRDDLRLQQLTELVKSQAGLTDEELRAAYAKSHERRRIAYVAFPIAEFMEEAGRGLDEPALRAYYTSHQDAVRTPVQRRLDYLGLSLAEALSEVPPQPQTDEELQSHLEQYEEQFTKSDGSLPALKEIRADVVRSWRTEQARRRLMDVSLDLQDAVDAGARMEELAAGLYLLMRTTAPLSLPAPDLPMGPTSSMMRDAFDQPLGHMTRVWHEPSGVFVLRPIEEFPSSVPPFEQVQERVRTLVLQERAREAAKSQATALREQLAAKRAEGLTPQECWLMLNLAPQRPEPVMKEEPIGALGQAPAVSTAVFALAPGQVSEVLDAPSSLVVAIVEETLPFDEQRFAQDKETFRTQQLDTAQQDHLTTWLSDVRARARLKDLVSKN